MMKSQAVSDLGVMLETMEPVLNDGAYVFVSLPPNTENHVLQACHMNALAYFREREGSTFVLEEAIATRFALPVQFRAAWISLCVHSDLQAVGLTAAFAHALAQAQISCNVFAGTYHDHIFVPIDLAEQAMYALKNLQNSGKN